MEWAITEKEKHAQYQRWNVLYIGFYLGSLDTLKLREKVWDFYAFVDFLQKGSIHLFCQLAQGLEFLRVYLIIISLPWIFMKYSIYLIVQLF